MDDDREFKTLIREARDPLAALALDLAARGYSAQMIARLFIQTSFAIIHEHYGREDVKQICARELHIFDEAWKQTN